VFGPIFFTQREKLTFAFLAMGLLDRKGVRKKVRGKCSCALGATKRERPKRGGKGSDKTVHLKQCLDMRQKEKGAIEWK